MNDNPIDLDIKYHLEGLADDSGRFYEAAGWMVEQFALESFSASISIVDDPTIHELNRTHLDHDWPTDVISFVFEPHPTRIDGEIIASADTARKLCVQAGWPYQDEILLYVVHGMLHLSGLDDIEDQQRSLMRAKEQQCLLSLGVAEASEHLARWEDVSY